MIKNLPAKVGDARDRFDSWVGRIPWRRKWQPTPVLLPVESTLKEGPSRLQSLGSTESDTTEANEHTHMHAHPLLNSKLHLSALSSSIYFPCLLASPRLFFSLLLPIANSYLPFSIQIRILQYDLIHTLTYTHSHLRLDTTESDLAHTHASDQIRLDQSLSYVRLFVTPWTVAHQALLSMGLPRREY